ncbi:hypothetical protein [Streptomyces sp. IBSBF 2435]|uniref:hypothetical protein n=1 Tax=Streptomyces sp. IBSBF 2435 TaxID=2903531 RepID=UPI002FDC79D3
MRSLHLRTLMAVAALTFCGFTTATGTAQAATTVHCAHGTQGLGTLLTGCDAFVDTGGPYTVNVDSDSVICAHPCGIFGGLGYTIQNAVLTCPDLVPYAGGYQSSACPIGRYGSA